jgi:hypothetical protein
MRTRGSYQIVVGLDGNPQIVGLSLGSIVKSVTKPVASVAKGAVSVVKTVAKPVASVVNTAGKAVAPIVDNKVVQLVVPGVTAMAGKGPMVTLGAKVNPGVAVLADLGAKAGKGTLSAGDVVKATTAALAAALPKPVAPAAAAKIAAAAKTATTTVKGVVATVKPITTTTLAAAASSAALPSLSVTNPVGTKSAAVPVKPPPLAPAVALGKDFAKALSDKETVNEWYGGGVTSLIAIARDAWNKDSTAKAKSDECKKLVAQAVKSKTAVDIARASEALDAQFKLFADFVAKRIRKQADAARASAPAAADDKVISDNEAKANRLLQDYIRDGWIAEQRKALPTPPKPAAAAPATTSTAKLTTTSTAKPPVTSIAGRPVLRGLLLITSGERAGRIYFERGAFMQADASAKLGGTSAVQEGLLLSTAPDTYAVLDSKPKKYIPVNV